MLWRYYTKKATLTKHAIIVIVETVPIFPPRVRQNNRVRPCPQFIVTLPTLLQEKKTRLDQKILDRHQQGKFPSLPRKTLLVDLSRAMKMLY